jgi:signal transduction histidine kinase
VTRHRVTISEFLADGLPRVLGVWVELQQVMLNLVVNGIEAMADLSDRPRDLVIRSERDEAHGVSGIFVTVQDAGPGFSEEDRARLFEAFYTTKPQGMGVGLSLSRSIVDAHGGRLWAISTLGRGATFQFVLPAAAPEAS